MALQSYNTSIGLGGGGLLLGGNQNLLNQIAQQAQQLAQQTEQWAQQQFAKDSQITDQAVQNYFLVNSQALGQAQHDLSRYNNLFQPEENQLIADANSYASPSRIALEMGSAEAGQEQAGEAGRLNAERELQSYGIDPSSGRYAELEDASRAQTAAAAAGAGQQARLATEATGRALRSEAIQVGERYPGQIINSLNTGLQADSGAVNATLANANTGVALKQSPVPFLNTAAGASRGQVSGGGGGGGSRGPSSGRPSGGGGGAPTGPSTQNAGAGSVPFTPKLGFAPGGGAGPSGLGLGGPDPFAQDPSLATSPWADNSPDAMPGGGTSIPYGSDPFNGGDYAGSGGMSDPSAATGGFADSGTYAMPGGGTSIPYGSDPFNGGDTSSWDPSSSDYYSSGDESYAQGGDVAPGATQGGFVSKTLSPSQGQQTDDVNAKLNAEEFVIPRDVARWKGQEFFQKLIAQSRQARVGAPAKPTRSGGARQGANMGGAI